MKSRNKLKGNQTIQDIYSSNGNFFLTSVDMPSKSKPKRQKKSKKVMLPSISKNSSLPNLKSIKYETEMRPKTTKIKRKKRMSMSATTIERLAKAKNRPVTEDDLQNTGK